ncbi:MAG: NAD-dependent protein deacylase [Filifactor alocis]|nr:NAD-dependent protein deacylase [Filifactor alocis]
MEALTTLIKWMEESDNLVFFGGAGVSTESDIPDFRSSVGLYSTTYGRFSPETILSRTFFHSHTKDFFRFYREKMLYPEARPNEAHKALAKLEKMGKLRAVITQNIDGLHQDAGSVNVLELHGSVRNNRCMSCNAEYNLDYICSFEDIPYCKVCNNIVKPVVTLYEEALDMEVLERSIQAVNDCDVLIVGGTSLQVYPAASLTRYYRGNKLVLINMDPTPYDSRADLLIHGRIGEVLKQAVSSLGSH